ncbi:Uncharacterised protein [Mycobacteroides abscessus subsp. abscessus]|nr:Uncharacterised protein [Mycobacteroides abscessus subsp. abscessus]
MLVLGGVRHREVDAVVVLMGDDAELEETVGDVVEQRVVDLTVRARLPDAAACDLLEQARQQLCSPAELRPVEVLGLDARDHGEALAGAGDDGCEDAVAVGSRQRPEVVDDPAVDGAAVAEGEDHGVPRHPLHAFGVGDDEGLLRGIVEERRDIGQVLHRPRDRRGDALSVVRGECDDGQGLPRPGPRVLEHEFDDPLDLGVRALHPTGADVGGPAALGDVGELESRPLAGVRGRQRRDRRIVEVPVGEVDESDRGEPVRVRQAHPREELAEAVLHRVRMLTLIGPPPVDGDRERPRAEQSGVAERDDLTGTGDAGHDVGDREPPAVGDDDGVEERKRGEQLRHRVRTGHPHRRERREQVGSLRRHPLDGGVR